MNALKSSVIKAVAYEVSGAEHIAENVWHFVQGAAWDLLWLRRREPLFTISVLGIRLYRRRWGHLRAVWRWMFGPCPFEWKRGPQ